MLPRSFASRLAVRFKSSRTSVRFDIGLLGRWVLMVLLVAAPLISAGIAQAAGGSDSENWPQWRGPLGSGAAPSANPPTEWSETKNVKWKVKIPCSGSATPIVWDNFVFIQTAIPTGKKGEAAVAKSDSPPPAEPPAGQTQSFASRLLDRLDTNKDGKISRAEVPEGALRGMFDRMVEKYKLDAEKTYTREELEKIIGATPKSDDQPPPPRPGGGQGGRPGGGPGGFGGGRGGAKPTEYYQFVLICIDRATGKTLWQQVAREEVPHEGLSQRDASFAAPSPVTDGKHVFAYFGSRGLYCYDMKGELEWSQDLGDMRIAMGFGEGSSPVLYGDAIIVNWDHEGGSFIIALDKNTGKTLWKKPRDERTSWSTPLVVEHDGKAQVITTASRKIRSYDLASGEIVWECGGLTANVIPSPVAGDGMLYATSGFQGSALLAIRLGRTGDLTGTDAIAWSHRRDTPYVPSPLLYGGRLYFFKVNDATLSSFDAKAGRALIEPQRIQGLQGVYASPVGAAGHVYLVSRNGTTVVLNNSEKLEVLATNRLNEGFDASPAIAGNELFLRGHEFLYCIAEK